MSKEDLKIINKRIKDLEVDRQRAVFDHNYQLASVLKNNIKMLKEHRDNILNENSENSEPKKD